MKDTQDIITELSGAEDVATWRIVVEDIAEERGYYDALGDSHAALFTEAGEVLLVSFEDEAAARARADRQPLGWDLAEARGWSSLVLLSQRPSWFRDPQVYAYFDRLVDDGFFDEFASVIFLGSGPGGYAAAAYSVTAPGATLIAIAPQATLTPGLARWDRRFAGTRRLDFTSRYGFAPAMAEAADQAFVIHDPAITEDAIHAALFAGRGAVAIRARHFGAKLMALLEQTGALGNILDMASDGSLTETRLYAALRARRGSVAWLRQLLAATTAAGDPHRVARLCRHVLGKRGKARHFRRALKDAEAEIAARVESPDNAST